MVLVAVAFLLFLTRLSWAPVPPINEDDPEIYVEWTTPADKEFWWRYSSGAVFVGNLFAGQYQFPWIVDIRSADLDMEQWAVGNLLTMSHVLTSNRAIFYIIEGEKKRIDAYYAAVALVATYEYTHININYCASYLWEDYRFNERRNWLLAAEHDLFTNDVPNSGTRYARYVYRHPLFRDDTLSYDIGIIKLNNPIRPLPPFMDLMPFWFDVLRRRVTDVDLSHMDDQRRVCYIASFGKNWRNIWDSIVMDYKVRYRVYYTDVKKCRENINFYRRGRDHHGEEEPLFYDKFWFGRDQVNLMCFQTRARVGAICDHDRGAPLVCNGLVYGFVARGANYTRCNNLLPIPFFVQKSVVLNSYFASVISHVYIPGYKGPQVKKSEAGCVAPGIYIQTISLLVLLWHNLPHRIGLATTA